ncbi:MAG: CoA transferase [Dehalococcoidia bacterium]|nr:CoA transferase [Dehalococcoidia bacterium]
MSRLPLEGIRVLDLTRAYAGTTATAYLADLGADVIKVEAASRPDIPTREINFAENDPGETPWERAAYFHRLNVGKRDITIDLTNPLGIDLFKRLVPHCDVVAENYNPQTMKRFGLDYEALSALNPRLIMVSMSGFGATGPWRHWAAYFPAMEGLSGLTSITGYPDGELLNSGTGYGDWLLGSAGAAAVLIALYHRNRTGLGQYIDVAGRAAVLAHLGELVLDYSMNGRAAQPSGNRQSPFAPNDCYRCAGDERWVAISVRDERDWDAFTGVLGNPDWALAPRFATPTGRWQHQDEMRPLIEAWTLSRDSREAARSLLAAGVPAAPVLDPRDILLDPQMLERDYWEVIDHPAAGRRIYPRQVSAHFSAVPRQPRTPPPLLGQHNREVFSGLLGMSEAEIAALEEQGIIGDRPRRATRGGPRPHPFATWREKGALIDDDYLDRLAPAFGPLGPSAIPRVEEETT